MLPAGVRSRRAHTGQVDLRDRHAGDHVVEECVEGHLLGESLVGEHEPVAERVLGERLQILGQRVLSPSDERKCRAAWTRWIGPRGLAPSRCTPMTPAWRSRG